MAICRPPTMCQTLRWLLRLHFKNAIDKVGAALPISKEKWLRPQVVE